MGTCRIHERMAVIAADGIALGVVTGIEGCRIRLGSAKEGAGFAGSAETAHPRYIALGKVAAIEGESIRLGVPADDAISDEEG